MTLKCLLCASAAAALLVLPTAAQASSAPQSYDGLIGAAKAAMMGDPAVALARSSDALKLAQAERASPEQQIKVATAQWLEGEALLRLNRPKQAAPLINQALAVVARLQPNTNLHGRLAMARGTLLGMVGEVQKAIEDYQAAYRIFETAREPRGQAMALQNIGSIYGDARDFPKMRHYFAQSAEIYDGDPALLVTAYNNTANGLKEQGDFRGAVAEYRQALTVAEKMESPLLQARILTNMASAEAQAGSLAAADAHVAQGLRMAASDPAAHEWRPYLWGVAAQIALERGQLKTAAELLDKTFAGVNPDDTSAVYRDFHETAYLVFKRLGDSRRALVHLQAFKRLDDEARTVAASTSAALVAARFDFANQESKIAKLKAAQLQKDIELAHLRNTTTLLLLAASAVLMCVLGWALFNMRRSRDQVRAANAKLSEANVSLEKALKARTEFLATTSHEIRTPLNGILGMTQVILRDRKLTAAMRDKIEVVHGAGETMLALVDDILDLAKIESGALVIAPEPMNLRALLQEAGRLWADKAAGKGLAFKADIKEAPTEIVEDPTRLRQVLFNLMSNAIKFTDAGSVTLRARIEGDRTAEVLALSVEDTGIGIAADQLDQIFESFRQVDGGITRQHGGTGLGLSISRRLAEGMGGALEVSSEPGRGSSFTLRLPLRRQMARDPAVPAAAHEANRLDEAVVLLIEASPLAHGLLRAGLGPHVRAFEAVASLEEGLAALPTRQVDLILVDGAIVDASPDGLAALLEAAGEARICVMAAALATDEAGLRAAGADDVIRKPISMADLLERLHQLFTAPRVAGRSVGRPTQRAS